MISPALPVPRTGPVPLRIEPDNIPKQGRIVKRLSYWDPLDCSVPHHPDLCRTRVCPPRSGDLLTTPQESREATLITAFLARKTQVSVSRPN
jgi:hypothetical protein